MSRTRILALALWSLPFASACYSGNDPAFKNGIPDLDGGVGVVAQDLPCDVSQVLSKYCIDCHYGGALAASKLALNSYAALTASSGTAGTALQLALTRVADTRDPMPPSGMPRPSAAEIQTLQSWADAGYPRGTCELQSDSDAGAGAGKGASSVYDTPVMCSSGTYWTGGNRESPQMHPGGTCITCHSTSREGPSFDAAGTVYASAHEPTDCNGSNQSGVTVIVTDANGKEISLHPNAAGNFYLSRSGLATPYNARVEHAGQVRAMVAKQTSGDCNSCHTQSGNEKAPGRIMIP